MRSRPEIGMKSWPCRVRRRRRAPPPRPGVGQCAGLGPGRRSVSGPRPAGARGDPSAVQTHGHAANPDTDPDSHRPPRARDGEARARGATRPGGRAARRSSARTRAAAVTSKGPTPGGADSGDTPPSPRGFEFARGRRPGPPTRGDTDSMTDSNSAQRARKRAPHRPPRTAHRPSRPMPCSAAHAVTGTGCEVARPSAVASARPTARPRSPSLFGLPHTASHPHRRPCDQRYNHNRHAMISHDR